MEKVEQPRGCSAHVVRIEGVPKGDGIAVVFAGPIVGLLTHWTSGRSHACPGVSKCPVTIHRGRTVWKGYSPVRKWNPVQSTWTAAVLEITEALEEQLRGRELIGEMWHLMRSSHTKKSAQVTGVFYARRLEEALLKPFDIIAPLQRLYHTTELELGATNQLPAKIMVEPVVCQGPTIFEQTMPREQPAPTAAQREALRKLSGRMQAQPATNGAAPKPALPH